MRSRCWLCLLGVLFAVSCSDSTGVDLGAVRLSPTVSGPDATLTGLTVTVDGAKSYPLGGGEPLTIPLDMGHHTLTFSGLAANCHLIGPESVGVGVNTGETTELAVQVGCTALTGVVEVRASTTGLDLDPDGYDIVLDGGANVDCSAKELVGFARLGSVYARDVLGRERPLVGLLNIGEEDEKGNAASRAAHELLKQTSGINYIGNIEGRDILAGHSKHGHVDVVVTDGFVGNIVLKFYESVARMIVRLVKRTAPDILERSDVQEVFRVLDYSEYGGAPLLGVDGVSIICHGSSGSNAIKNAIRVAAQMVETKLNQHVAAEFAAGAAPVA